MKATPRHDSDGIALIMVMCAIFVLSALAAGFALSMKVETKLAQKCEFRAAVALAWPFWCGICGAYILSQHPPGGKLPIR